MTITAALPTDAVFSGLLFRTGDAALIGPVLVSDASAATTSETLYQPRKRGEFAGL